MRLLFLLLGMVLGLEANWAQSPNTIPPSPTTEPVSIEAFYQLPELFKISAKEGSLSLQPELLHPCVQQVKTNIMNRFGQVLFTTNDPNINWDGTYQKTGQPVPSREVYIYECTFIKQDCLPQQRPTLKGQFMLLRMP